MRTTTEPATAPIERDPEIIVPAELEPYYDAAYAAAQKAGVTQEGNPFWARDVEALCRSIVAQRYGGVIPGTVRRPYSPRFANESGIDSRGIDAATYNEWVRAYEEDQRADAAFGDQFRAEVEELITSILTDPFRSLRLHFHFQAIQSAQTAKKSHDRREASHREYVRVNTCPVCHQCQPSENGAIKTRALTGDALNAYTRGGPTIRSCFSCWSVAHAIHVYEIGRKRIDSAGRTRSDVVASHLGSLPQAT